MATKQCERECPYCGSIDMGLLSIYEDSDYIEELRECSECGREFRQFYDKIIAYTETVYKEIPLNNKTLFDKG